MKANKQTLGLNEIQMGLLRMFDRKIPDDDVLEIKRILVRHLSEKLKNEVAQVVIDKSISELDFKKLETDHQRTKLDAADE